MADETRQIQVLLGPYRDHRLTVSAADAESAINNHWAVDPHAAPDDHPHPPLSEEERTQAVTSATEWAQLQWDTAQGIAPPDPPPPEGGVTRRRAMTPDDTPSGSYSTRDTRNVDDDKPKRRT